MAVGQAAQRRRDNRYPVRRGCARFELSRQHPGDDLVVFEITEFSNAGIGFELGDTSMKIEVGTVLNEVTVRVGSCVMSGNILVRNVRTGESGNKMAGALFYPSSTQCQVRLMAMVAGLSAKA